MSTTLDASSSAGAACSSGGRLLQVLGMWFGIAAAIGNTIAAGIVAAQGYIASFLPNVWLFLGVWMLGGLYALFGAASLAELGAAIPRRALSRVGLSMDNGHCINSLHAFPRWCALHRPCQHTLGPGHSRRQLPHFSRGETTFASRGAAIILLNFFRDRFRLQEVQQIVLSACLGIRSRHIETAERMSSDHRAGAFAVQVQIADVKYFFRLF